MLPSAFLRLSSREEQHQVLPLTVVLLLRISQLVVDLVDELSDALVPRIRQFTLFRMTKKLQKILPTIFLKY